MRPDWHKHKCPECDWVWEHDGYGEDLPPDAHRCHRCGTGRWLRYYGDQTPDHTTRPRESAHDQGGVQK